MSLSTADCRNWLSTNPKIQQLVSDNSGVSDGEVYHAQWVVDAKKPNKWKRQSKHKVGSKLDLANSCPVGDIEGIKVVKSLLGIDPTGGVLRNFWLEATDHITLQVLELNNQLYLLDDLSD